MFMHYTFMYKLDQLNKNKKLIIKPLEYKWWYSWKQINKQTTR
jgi:hypothetical protein